MPRALASGSFIIIGSLLAVATPAVATPAQSAPTASTFSSLYSYTEVCESAEDGSRTCTYISLSVSEHATRRTSAETIGVTVNKYRFEVDGAYTPIRFESGEAGGDGSKFSINRDLTATLAPTTISLRTCDGYDCYVSRDVVISASDSPTDAVRTSRSTSTSSDGTCTERVTTTTKHAPVAGTITLDGVVYDEIGQVSKTSTTVSRRCP